MIILSVSLILPTFALADDTTPPTTTPTTSPVSADGLNGWFKTTPSITLTRDEPGITYYSWTSATGPWTTYSTPFNAPEGQNTLYYYSVDTAGNAEAVKSQLFKLDTQPPASFIQDLPADVATINKPYPYFSWNASSDATSGLARYQLYIDGSLSRDNIINWTAAIPSTALSNGSHAWLVRSWDNAGNYTDSDIRSLTISVGPEKIVFFSNRDGNSEIYVMNADGSAQTNITDNSANDKRPAFSPDGTKVVFHSNRDGGPDQIWVINVDGSNPIKLTNDLSGPNRPVFSYDGSKVAFHSGRDGNREIYIMDADGSNQMRLLQTIPPMMRVPSSPMMAQSYSGIQTEMGTTRYMR